MLVEHFLLQLIISLRVSAPPLMALLTTLHEKHGKQSLLPKGSKYPKATNSCNQLNICALAHRLQNRYSLPFRGAGGTATKFVSVRSVSAKENIGSRKGRGPAARWGGFSGPIQTERVIMARVVSACGALLTATHYIPAR